MYLFVGHFCLMPDTSYRPPRPLDHASGVISVVKLNLNFTGVWHWPPSMFSEIWSFFHIFFRPPFPGKEMADAALTLSSPSGLRQFYDWPGWGTRSCIFLGAIMRSDYRLVCTWLNRSARLFLAHRSVSAPCWWLLLYACIYISICNISKPLSWVYSNTLDVTHLAVFFR